MKVVAEIFSQGEEVVSGQTVDSNAAWLSQQLNELGFCVKRHTAVGDRLAELVELITEIAARADCCICTGGLGPTIDDLTAEAAGLASGQALVLDSQALQQIETYFANRKRSMPDINRKQAYFPEHAQRIDNPVGTAPGFTMQIQRCLFVFLPGVPSEMKAMFPTVVDSLKTQFDLRPQHLVTLRSIGIGESSIQHALAAFNLPARVQLGFRAAPDEVQTKLLFPEDFPESDMAAYVRQVADLIGDYVFSVDGLGSEPGGDLIAVLDRELSAGNKSVAVLETASGGALAAKCRGREWLKTTLVVKDTATAVRQWHSPEYNGNYAQLAASLAQTLKQQTQTDLALVQLFIGSEEDYQRKDKIVTLYNGLYTDAGATNTQHTLGGVAHSKQNQAALLSLDLIRRYLQNKCH